MALKRLAKELLGVEKEATPGVIKCGPTREGDMLNWTAIIAGPPDSPYEGGTFELAMRFPPEFPLKAPVVTFVTKVYHPNVNAEGGICVDILKSEAWSPAYSVPKILLSLQSLLADPNPDQALMPEIGAQCKDNREEFNKTAREWTEKHAKAAGAAAATTGGSGTASA